jgi:hypothetical protein
VFIDSRGTGGVGQFFLGAADTCFAQTIPAGGTCTTSVDAKPTTLGDKNGTLTLGYDSASKSLGIPLHANSVQPTTAVTITPSVDFGAVALGSTSTSRTVTLTNTGSAASSVGNAALSGAQQSDFSIASDACGLTLQPGATCDVTVTFTPSVRGARTATLTVPTAAGNRTSTLTGSGNAAPQLTLPQGPTVELGAPIDLTVSATDADGDHLTLTTGPLPAGLGFTDNGNGTGRLAGAITAVGTYPVEFRVSDGVNALVTGTVTIVVGQARTTLTYTGTTFIPDTRSVVLSARLTRTVGGTPLAGRLLTLGLGAGAGAQSCTGNTNAAGSASCTINPVAQPLGPGTATASFAGEASFALSSASVPTLVFRYLNGQSFAVGDLSASIGATVTYYGGAWAVSNTLSNTAKPPPQFKGFVQQLASDPAQPGGTWSTPAPDQLVPPPSVPSYMAVLITSRVDRNRSQITGNVTRLAVIQTDPGYSPAASKATGRLVAFLP